MRFSVSPHFQLLKAIKNGASLIGEMNKHWAIECRFRALAMDQGESFNRCLLTYLLARLLAQSNSGADVNSLQAKVLAGPTGASHFDWRFDVVYLRRLHLNIHRTMRTCIGYLGDKNDKEQ
jgi:hypothetical protein